MGTSSVASTASDDDRYNKIGSDHDHDVGGATTTVVQQGDLENQKHYVEANWVHKAALTVLGVADLFYWNCVLNILYDIRDKIYPDYPSMTDTLNAVNVLSTLLVAIYTVKTGAMNPTLTVIAGGLLSVACLLTAICVQWIPGIGGVVVLHIANCIAGACSGLYQTGGCGVASVIGEGGLSGYVSTGQGITGVLTFAIWQAISQSSLKTKPALWTLMSIGCFVTIASSINFWYMVTRPEIAARVAVVRKSLKDEASNADAPSYLLIFKRCWIPMVTVFWSFYITLFFFPNIGPINWNEGDFTNYTLGAFQVGDLIGRYLPIVIPFLCMTLKVASWFAVARTIFLPLAILSWKFPSNAFWGSNAWHMVLMALMSITNGALVTAVWMRAPSSLEQKDWRSRAMSLVVLCTLSGIAAGLWSARIFTAFAIDS